MRVGVFTPGTQHAWQTARALQKGSYLAWFVTSIFYKPDKWPYRAEQYLPSRLRQKANYEFRRFFHPDLDPSLVRAEGIYEWAHRLAARARFRTLAKRLNRISNAAMSERVGRLLIRDPVDILWGYGSCSLEAFQTAKQVGINCILDQTIGDARWYNQIIAKVLEQYPDFYPNMNFKLHQKFIDRQDEEYDLSHIIMAGSQFCYNTIIQFRPDLFEKVHVLKYCYDDLFFGYNPPTERPVRTPIRFIFVGQAGARKGIHLLLRAFDRIPSSGARLTILGDLQVPREIFARYAGRVQVIRTVRRDEVAEILRQADCLVFPSYFEGSAISIYEALACGLGVIQSRFTGMEIDETVGSTLKELTEEGLYVEMMRVIENPEILSRWKSNAWSFVQSYTFGAYAESVRTECLKLQKQYAPGIAVPKATPRPLESDSNT